VFEMHLYIRNNLKVLCSWPCVKT